MTNCYGQKPDSATGNVPDLLDSDLNKHCDPLLEETATSPNPAPLVSVILPVYNSSQFVAQALDSVLAQSFVNLEVIVIDDGSNDATLGALKPYLDSINLVKRRHKGPASARNAGICQAKGEFIAFLDSDDIWFPEKLRGQISYLTRHPEIGIVFCDVKPFGRSCHSQCGGEIDPWTHIGAPIEDLLSSRPIALSSVVVRRSCLDTVGLFDESLMGAEDYNLFIRLSRYYQFGYIEQVMVLKRNHENNLSDDLVRMRGDEIANLHKIAALFPHERLSLRPLSGQIHFRFGKYHFDKKEFGNARRCFFAALAADPVSLSSWVRLAAACLPKVCLEYLLANKRKARGRLSRIGRARVRLSADSEVIRLEKTRT